MPSSSSEYEVFPSSPKMEEVMTMVIFFHSSADSCGSDHGIAYLLEKRRSARFWKGVHLMLPTKMSSSDAGAMA